MPPAPAYNAIVAALEREIGIFECSADEYGYLCLVLQKKDRP
jgi:hypothetical protein